MQSPALAECRMPIGERVIPCVAPGRGLSFTHPILPGAEAPGWHCVAAVGGSRMTGRTPFTVAPVSGSTPRFRAFTHSRLRAAPRRSRRAKLHPSTGMHRHDPRRAQFVCGAARPRKRRDLMRRTFTWLLFALFLAASALGQSSSTATIRGKVTNEKGSTLGGAEINAVGTNSGFVKTVKAGPDGSFVLPGLTPGEYNIVVAATGYEPRSETVRVFVGQQPTVNFVLTPTAVVNQSITVVGNQLVDTKSPEVGTNITPQQMENLPQDDRNFLKFAALAPGIQIGRASCRERE